MPTFSGKELLRQTEVVSYWAEPLLTKGGIMLLAAPEKSMKTYFGLHLAGAISSGSKFLGWPTERGRVLYLDWEIGVGEAKKRWEPIDKIYPDNDFFIHMMDAGEPMQLDEVNGKKNLHKTLKEIVPDVVFIDTLRMSMAGDENSSTEVVKFFNSLKDMQRELNFSSVIIHHTGKKGENTKLGEVRNMRGSSVIGDYPSTLGVMEKYDTSDKEPAKLDIYWKFRNHAPIAPFELEFDPDTGLFIRRTAPIKEKGKDVRGALRKSKTKDIDISDGLLPESDR